jgi:hypothetical protein
MRSHGRFSQTMKPLLSSEEDINWVGSNSGRRVYPYSIIRGGIESVAELKHAIQSDSVAAKHFSDFDLSQARIVKLPIDKVAYVSYRVKDKVYWTQKKIKLARGEKIITDGVNSARTRCANRISETAGASLGPHEPSPEVLDTPEENPVAVAPPKSPIAAKTNNKDLTPPLVAAIPTSAAVPSGGRFPMFIPFVVGGGAAAGTLLRPSGSSSAAPFSVPFSGGGGSSVPPISASEPGAFLLLASGFAASGMLLKRKRE